MSSKIGRGHLGAEEELGRALRESVYHVFDDYSVTLPTGLDLRSIDPASITHLQLAYVVATMLADMQKRGTTRSE
jgi:hypothetical protein